MSEPATLVGCPTRLTTTLVLRQMWITVIISSQAEASRHANVSHHGKIPCRYRTEFSCEALFENTQEEGCMSTVMGHLLSIAAWPSHARMHLADDEGYDIAIDRNLAGGDIDGGMIQDDYPINYFDSCFPLAKTTSDLEEIEACKSSFQKRNQQLLREFPQARRDHEFVGLKCIGPSPIVNRIVTTVCPNGSTLDYTTAKIKVTGHGECFKLPIRYFDCEVNYIFHRLLKKHKLLGKAKDQICSGKNCFQPACRQSQLCKDHLLAWRGSPMEFADYTGLRAPALANTWVADESVRFVFDLLLSTQAGNTNGSDLRFLDLEFNPRTKRIFEIGMCDAKGDLTLDYRTRYQPETLAIINHGRDTKNTYMDHAIDRSTKGHHCVDSRMSARQVADRLREQGVSPRTWFVTWHHTTLNLSALREWLESEGEFDVLPDDGRCLPIMHHIRRNLKVAPGDDGRTVPAALSVLFPLVMGSQHELAGRNHHAAVDAHRTYHLTEVYLMQCRRPADRPDGWLESLQKPEGWTVGQQQRQTIKSFWKKAGRDEQ
ncbi:hypothetical protein GQX73_g10613 [Xylaria multiplex]|uniref:Uncharacterized protein n=1 Tax=Xylaria multiplex TaxID=323545 RepID=A0A7C8IKV4_9PEZI|nr:hypothetical protein GQX73_g10613 [Xylaria multiplex]